MKYACEIMDAIAIETLQKEAERFAKAMAAFEESLEKIDKYVEDKLMQGKGSATLLIDNTWGSGAKPDGFYYFAEKDYYNHKLSYPYWTNTKETEYFPLDWYIKYLEGYCYKVEVVYLPFTATSSTGKSYVTMKGMHLKISTDCTA